MQKREIDIPLIDNIKLEHRALYIPNGNMSAVAAKAGMSASTLSRHMNTDEEVKDHLWETIAEMIGAVKAGSPDIALGVYQMITSHAIELGLVDSHPITVLRNSTSRLRRITPEDIKALNESEMEQLLAATARLQEEARRIATLTVNADPQPTPS